MAKRDSKGRFVPGQSGNPAGINATTQKFREMCRTAAPEVFENLMAILRSKRAAAPARVRAGEIILSYAYGKPKEIDLSDGQGSKIQPLHIVIEGSNATVTQPPETD